MITYCVVDFVAFVVHIIVVVVVNVVVVVVNVVVVVVYVVVVALFVVIDHNIFRLQLNFCGGGVVRWVCTVIFMSNPTTV